MEYEPDLDFIRKHITDAFRVDQMPDGNIRISTRFVFGAGFPAHYYLTPEEACCGMDYIMREIVVQTWHQARAMVS
jgi:hypothetical protein